MKYNVKKGENMWIKKEDLDKLAAKKLNTGQEMWDFLVSEKKSKVSIINIIASILILIGLTILNVVASEENSLVMFIVSILLMLSYMIVCFLKINDKRSFIANITELIIVLLSMYLVNSIFSLFNIFDISFNNVSNLFFGNIGVEFNSITLILGLVLGILLFLKNKNNMLVSLIYLILIFLMIKLSIFLEIKEESRMYLVYYIGIFSIFITLISKIGILKDYTQTLTTVSFLVSVYMFQDEEIIIMTITTILLLLNILVWKDIFFTKIAYMVLFITTIVKFDFDSIHAIILMVLSIAYAIRNKDLKLIGTFSFVLLIIIDNYFKLEFVEQVFYYMLAGISLLIGNHIYRKKLNKKEQ